MIKVHPGYSEQSVLLLYKLFILTSVGTTWLKMGFILHNSCSVTPTAHLAQNPLNSVGFTIHFLSNCVVVDSGSMIATVGTQEIVSLNPEKRALFHYGVINYSERCPFMHLCGESV